MLLKSGTMMMAFCCWVLLVGDSSAAPRRINSYPSNREYESIPRVGYPAYQQPERSEDAWREVEPWNRMPQRPDNGRTNLALSNRYEDEVDGGRGWDGNYGKYDQVQKARDMGLEDGAHGVDMSDPAYIQLYQMLLRTAQEDQYGNGGIAWDPREAAYYPDSDNLPEKGPVEGWSREPLDPNRLESLLTGNEMPYESAGGLVYDPPSRSNLGVLQRIGMRLVDLTDIATSESSVSVEDADHSSSSQMESEEYASSEVQPMTIDKAKTLLKQLEKVETQRSTKSAKLRRNEEVIDKNQLAAMLGKDELESTAVSAEDEAKEDNSGIGDLASYSASESNSGDEQIIQDLKDEQLALMSEQNKLLMQALQLAPFEAIQSQELIARLRGIIGKASELQNAVEFVSSKLNELVDTK